MLSEARDLHIKEANNAQIDLHLSNRLRNILSELGPGDTGKGLMHAMLRISKQSLKIFK